MRNTQDIIVRLLRSIGNRKEVDLYLKQFSSVDSRKFGVIKVGAGLLSRELDGLASSLTFLSQVGLHPIVVHGADAATALPSDPASVRRQIQRDNLRLVEALEELGTRARPVGAGVFEVEPSGRIVKVHAEAIDSSMRAGALPILTAVGETSMGQVLDVDCDAAARALALALEPFKIVLLEQQGGLLDGNGAILSAINLAEDYEPLLREPWLDERTRRELGEIRALLDALPPSSSVSITSPDNLARELFTHRGSGTLIRKGDRVQRHDTLDPIDRPRLRALLEECFGRALAPAYFDDKPFFRVYLADSYRATAILTQEPSDGSDGSDGSSVPYLDKFAVTQEAQGAGVGGSMWQRMQRENPKLFWRSRVDNPINAWYFERADGSFRSDAWTVFWYGLGSFAEARACVERALAMPASLAPIPGAATGGTNETSL